MKVNAIQKVQLETTIVDTYFCIRLNFLSPIEFLLSIDYRMVMHTETEKIPHAVHCRSYHMEVDRREKIRAKSFDKKFRPNFSLFVKFHMIMLTVLENTFCRVSCKQYQCEVNAILKIQLQTKQFRFVFLCRVEFLSPIEFFASHRLL